MVQGRIIKRLLGQPSNDNSPDPNLGFESRVDRSLLRPSASQTSSLIVGSSLTCIDKSPTGNFAVVAGEKVFKIIRVDGRNISEEHDLRAGIASHTAGQGDSLSAFNDQLSIKTAKWAHGDLDTIIITASANGRITLYDLNRIGSGLEVGRIREHTRQVHKFAVNPWRPASILTASQDGSARLFDIKSPDSGRNGQIFHSRSIFKCNADAVRDIKWSPNDGFFFACSTASGTVQYWDRRKNIAPVLKINAHDSPCLSISWHPDGKHLISGGFDQRCHVWDLSGAAEKRQKPKYSFSTPAPVSIVSWRPACWSYTAQANRAAQVATVYDDMNPMKTKVSTVHLWDLARPFLPFKEISDFETSPTGLLWSDRDLLWTVGRGGDFAQTDAVHIPKVLDRRSLSTFDFSSSGEVLMLLEERKGRVRSVSPPPETHHRSKSSGNQSGVQSQNHSPSGNLSLSRSDSDEDVVGSFLGGHRRSKAASRRQSTRSLSSFGSTPPSVTTADGALMNLDEAVEITGPYKPLQVMALGHIPAASQRGVYQYLSSHYLHCIMRDIRDSDQKTNIGERMTVVLDHFSKSANVVGHFRLAQSWKVLGYTMRILLERRSQHYRKTRLARVEEKRRLQAKIRKGSKDGQAFTNLVDHLQSEDVTPKKLERSRSPMETLSHPGLRSIISEEIENTSNMSTPLARPVRESIMSDPVTARKIASVEDDRLDLPPAAYAQSPSKRTSQRVSPDENASSSEGYDFYDLPGLSTAAIDITAPQRKAPFRLEFDPRQSSYDRAHALARHDSNESFQMFSTSNESHRLRFPGSSESAEQHSASQVSLSAATSQPRTQDTEASWDSSMSSNATRAFRALNSQDDDLSSVSVANGSYNLNNVPIPQIHHVTEPDTIEASAAALLEAGVVDASRAQLQAAEDETSTEIINSDFYPQTIEPAFVPAPIDPHILIQRTIQFEVQTGCLNAAAIILLLKPLLAPGTIDDGQAAAIVRTYHERLTGMQLFEEAAMVRKLCWPGYASTYGQGLHNVVLGYFCLTCEAPLGVENVVAGVKLQKCTTCQQRLKECMICDLGQSPEDFYDEEKLLVSNATASDVWWWCQGCGHGGHTICMQTYHNSGPVETESDGCCPSEGCLHPCLPGTWRDELIAEVERNRGDDLTKAVRENVRDGGKISRKGSVKRDERIVGESKAVESVRGALVGNINAVDRKKTVKVIAPGEE